MSASASSSVGVLLDANSPPSSAEMARTISSTPSEMGDCLPDEATGTEDMQQLEIISDLVNDADDDVVRHPDEDNARDDFDDDEEEEEEDSRSFNTVAEANVATRHQQLERIAQLSQAEVDVEAKATAALADAVAQHFDVGGQLSDSSQSFEYVVGGSNNGGSDSSNGVLVGAATAVTVEVKRSDGGRELRVAADGRYVGDVMCLMDFVMISNENYHQNRH